MLSFDVGDCAIPLVIEHERHSGALQADVIDTLDFDGFVEFQASQIFMGSAGDEVDIVLAENLDWREFIAGFEELDVGDEHGSIDLLERDGWNQKFVLGEVVIKIVIYGFHFF